MTELRTYDRGRTPPRTLKEMRVSAGITQRALAEDQEVSIPAVCRWEDGTAWPSIDRLPSMARTLGVTVSDLVTALILTKGGDRRGQV